MGRVHVMEESTPRRVTIVAVTFAAMMVMMTASVTPVGADTHDETGLDCLEETESELADRLHDVATETVSELPPNTREAIADERSILTVDESTHFSGSTDSVGNVETVQVGEMADPSLLIRTDCQTVDAILNAENTWAELELRISQGDIEFEGVTVQTDVVVNYITSFVQAQHIIRSGESGDLDDAAEGFINGLTLQ